MCPTNEGWRYIVTSSLIGWKHTQNDPCGRYESSIAWCCHDIYFITQWGWDKISQTTFSSVFSWQKIAVPLYHAQFSSRYCHKPLPCSTFVSVALSYQILGFYSLRRHSLMDIGIPTINLRQLSDCLRPITGIPILMRWHLFLASIQQ